MLAFFREKVVEVLSILRPFDINNYQQRKPLHLFLRRLIIEKRLKKAVTHLLHLRYAHFVRLAFGMTFLH